MNREVEKHSPFRSRLPPASPIEIFPGSQNMLHRRRFLLSGAWRRNSLCRTYLPQKDNRTFGIVFGEQGIAGAIKSTGRPHMDESPAEKYQWTGFADFSNRY